MVKKALFWDFDGTLILPNESFLDALQHALKPFNYSVNPETIRIFLRSACPWYHPEKSYTDTTGVNWWDHFFESFEGFYMEHSIADSDREKINQLFKEYILNDKNYTVYPDADMVLHQCHGMGYKNYILTNNFPELAVIAKRIGLSKHIDDYIISTNIGFEKPRPELFQYALRIANVPDICYMIGDNPVADIQGGKQMGMKTIFVHKGICSEADYNCDDLKEIPALLCHLTSIE